MAAAAFMWATAKLFLTLLERILGQRRAALLLSAFFVLAAAAGEAQQVAQVAQGAVAAR